MTDALHHKPSTWLGDVPEYRGLWSWVTSIDHKQIGVMYVLSALFFFVIAVGLALVMKAQLAVPMNHIVNQDTYNQIFTMHGTTMVFLVGMPLIFGFGVYLTPLMIGARDMAFPRLNAMGFWIFLFGAMMLYFSFVGGGAPSAGWFSYAPLTEKGFLSNPGIDYWAPQPAHHRYRFSGYWHQFDRHDLGIQGARDDAATRSAFCLDDAEHRHSNCAFVAGIERRNCHDRV